MALEFSTPLTALSDDVDVLVLGAGGTGGGLVVFDMGSYALRLTGPAPWP